MSLPELLVVMMLTTVVLACGMTVFVGVTGGVRAVNTKNSANRDLRIAGEALSRSLRVAYKPPGQASAITYASPTEITFYALLDRRTTTPTPTPTTWSEPAPTLVRYRWTGSCLTETHDSGAAKCLLRTTTAPTFAYYPTGQLTTGGTAVAPLPISGGQLTASQRAAARSVAVTLTARDPGAPDVNPVVTTIRVSLQNVLLTEDRI